MNLDRLAERARWPFWRPSWNSPSPTTFFTLKIISMDSLTLNTCIKTPNSSLQDRSRWTYIGYKDAVAILDAILNYNFLPHIWNVYPSFFQSPMGPLQGSRVKIRGHMIAHRTPSAPGLLGICIVGLPDEHIRRYCIVRSSSSPSNRCSIASVRCDLQEC